MWIGIGIIAAFCFLFSFAIYLAKNEGSKAAKLEALKAEIKRQAEEQRRANEIADRVRNMSDNDVHSRLHNLQSK